jgi:hypothetical protein
MNSILLEGGLIDPRKNWSEVLYQIRLRHPEWPAFIFGAWLNKGEGFSVLSVARRSRAKVMSGYQRELKVSSGASLDFI